MTRILSGRVCALIVALVSLPGIVLAQGNASAAASAMGGNYTALARNFNAVAWNPANLGLDGNKRFSLALSPQFGLGTGPVTLQDLADYEGVVVPSLVREAWLQKIADNGGQNIGGEFNVTPLALSIGHFALAATTTIRTDGDLPAAVAELIMFGNAGRTGSPKDYELRDLRLDGNATSTVGLSYGRRIGLMPFGDFAIGVTGKYIIGHGMASMRDNGSTITSNPVAVTINAPIVVTDTAEYMNNGSGYGLDVGATWKVGNLRAAAVVHDLFSTFAWNTDRLYYIPVEATFDESGSSQTIDSLVPLSSAPQAVQDELRARIAGVKVTPTIALGVAWSGINRLTLTSDIRQRFGDGLELGAKTQIGVGAELRLIPFIPLRAGITTLGDGMRYSGGLGLEFGVVNIQASAALLNAKGRNETAVGLTFSLFGH